MVAHEWCSNSLFSELLAFIIILYILFVPVPDILKIIGIIIAAVIAYFTILKYLAGKREREKLIIKKIIEKSINPNIGKIREHTKIQEFKFPESLHDRFFIYVDDEIFHRFSKRRRVMGWRLRRFDKICNNLTERIKNLENKAQGQELIKKGKTELGRRWVLNDKHKNSDKKELLQKYGLLSGKEIIGKFYKKLRYKSKKVLKKLENLKDKWKDTHNIK